MNIWTNVEKVIGKDENVIKFIFTNETAIAEAVLYKYPSYKERTVMCISTQSGCNMGCTFCGTGKFFNRNLSSEEILEQVSIMEDYMSNTINECDKVQIMFMSMGEPLMNMHNLEPSLINLYNSYPDSKLLISTSAPSTNKGWDKFINLSVDIPNIGLQFSVHESTDEDRNKLIPFKGKMNLSEISEMGDLFYSLTGRNPFFNYCVHENNNRDTQADNLLSLFNPSHWECTLSVICESDQSMAEAVEDSVDMVNEFSSKMIIRGFNTRVFNPAGQDDIGGGCGQLWQVQKFAENNPHIMKQSAGNKILVRDITDE